jgi:hypothetical protein
MKSISPYIRLVRYPDPDDEPHYVRLAMTASNRRVRGYLEFSLPTAELMRWADSMETFPVHAGSALIYECGSERPEDRCASHFRLRVATVDLQGHSVIEFRCNNNEEFPNREIAEFCIQTDPAAINRFGQVCRAFADLKHEVLEWTPISERLFESLGDREQEFAAFR